MPSFLQVRTSGFFLLSFLCAETFGHLVLFNHRNSSDAAPHAPVHVAPGARLTAVGDSAQISVRRRVDVCAAPAVTRLIRLDTIQILHRQSKIMQT